MKTTRPGASAIAPFLLLLMLAAASRPAPGAAAHAEGDPAPPALPAPRLEPSPLAPESGPVRALALDARGARVAVAAGRGVLLRSDAGTAGPVVHRGAAVALAFDATGGLWIGGEDGLFHTDTTGRSEERTPAPGARARTVHALAAHGGVVLAGTEAGAYATADGRSFAPLGGGMPGGAVTAVALRADGEALEAWLVTGGELWRAALARGAAGVRVAHAERAAVFGGGAGGPCVDVAVGLQGSDVVALAPDALAVRSVGEGAWRTLRPSFPPGASALRIGGALGRTWIATDRGLLVGPALEGPFERAPGGVGGEPVLALAGDASVVLAGTDEGLWSGRAAGDDGARRTTVWVDALPPAEPRIEAVHRAALAYLDLAPERMQRLREGAARRGFLPVVGVHLGRDVGRFQRRDDDESFVSGEVRRLHDRQRDRSHDYGAALSFEWELGDAAYDPEEVDVSKEAREVIELRDDVLDEITQLYFERRRVLLDLASAPPPEAARLRLRADELAAGLDAWTGGWFGRQVGRLAP